MNAALLEAIAIASAGLLSVGQILLTLMLLSSESGLKKAAADLASADDRVIELLFLDLLEAGYYIGITGWVCDQRRGEALRGLVPLIPLDRLLIETDAPFLRPHNAPPADNSQHRKRNEPALLPFVVRQLAELYSCDPEHLASQTHGNAERLFDLAD